MTIPADVQAALDRLAVYNSNPYSEANPRGLGNYGNIVNFPAALSDLAKAVNYIAGQIQAFPVFNSVVRTGNFATTADDRNAFIRVASSSTVSIALHANAEPGTTFWLSQDDIGTMAIAAAPGATIQALKTPVKSRERYAVIGALCVANVDGASAVWRLGGDLDFS